MQLHATVDQTHLGLGGPPFGHRGLFGGQFVREVKFDEFVHHDSHRGGFGRQFSKQESAVLKGTDRLAERLAFLDVGNGVLKYRLHCGRRHDRQRNSFLRQVLHEIDEAHALLADQILDRHFDIGERQLSGVLRVQADLVEVTSAFEARHPPLHGQQGKSLRALIRVGLGHHDYQVGVDAVGDERLGPIEDVVIAISDCARLDALKVAAGAGFGHGDSRDHLAGGELRQPALLLLPGGQVEQIGRNDVVMQGEPEAAVPAGHGLFGDDGVVAKVRVAAAAVLLRHRHTQVALLAGLQPYPAVDDLVLLPLSVVGRDVLVQERPVGLPEQLVLGFEQGAGIVDGLGHDDLRVGILRLS